MEERKRELCEYEYSVIDGRQALSARRVTTIFLLFLLYCIKFSLFLRLFKDGSVWFSHEELISYLLWLPLTCMFMKMPNVKHQQHSSVSLTLSVTSSSACG